MTDDRKWWLANVEERAQEHPRSFKIPRRPLREDIRAGDMVKLVFETQPDRATGCAGERMWVRVERRLKDEASGRIHYHGRLLSSPAFVPLAKDDDVTFGPEHIADVD